MATTFWMPASAGMTSEHQSVTPAKAGVHDCEVLDARLRGHDE